MDFEMYESQLTEKVTLLILVGRFSAASAPQVREKIKQLTDDNHIEIILDMSAVNFLDSSGLAALVSALKCTRKRGGWLRLAGVTDAVMNVFKQNQLDRVFTIHSNVEAALRAS